MLAFPSASDRIWHKDWVGRAGAGPLLGVKRKLDEACC